MATLTQEAIDTFVSITGASNSVAVRILQAYYGDLNVAVNKYFTEGGDQNLLHEALANIPQDNAMDIDEDDTAPALQSESHLSSEARTTVPFPYRHPNFEPSGRSNDVPSIEDPAAQGRIIVDEEIDDDSHSASTSEREASEVVSIPGQQGTQASNGSLLSEDEDEDEDDDSDSDYVEEEQEQPLVRRARPRKAVSGSRSPANEDLSRSPEAEGAAIHSPDADYGFTSEWGGISSVEHDEAVMLEAAMFGGIPHTEYRFPYAPHLQRMQQRPPSPSLTAQRLIREQQDDEYLASLEADQVKAEAHQLEEKAARVKALEEEKRKEEEAHRKVEEEQELERQLVSKEASLPQEPPAGEENTITLLVRLPDGTRHGRRFLKSDKLQSLFDFVDICRVVKPNTYRLVRPYPRHAFGDGESASTLNEIGLTSKHEALFLELI